jgi:hypothetical protein
MRLIPPRNEASSENRQDYNTIFTASAVVVFPFLETCEPGAGIQLGLESPEIFYEIQYG